VQNFSQEARRDRPLGYLDVDEDNIKTDLKEIGCECLYWIQLAQLQWWFLVNTVMNLRVP
jgi:hypothetical protein